MVIDQYAYDIEVLPNYFGITIVDMKDYFDKFKDACNIKIKKGKEIRTPRPLTEKLKVKDIVSTLDTIKCWQFDITDYDDSQLLKMIAFINGLAPHKDKDGNQHITYMYGFNSFKYDKLMTACLLMYSFEDIKFLLKKLYTTSQDIIRLQDDREAFRHDYYMRTLCDYNLPYKDIDIMKIFALNKVGSMVNDKGEKIYYGKSLKQTSINIKWYELLEWELPPISEIDYYLYANVPRYKGLTPPQLDAIINKWDRLMVEAYRKPMNHYNKNDVFIVCELCRLYMDEIKLRYRLSRAYEVDLMNSSRSNIANILFEKMYSDFSGLEPYQWKGKKTERTIMSFKRVIFDNVKFKTPEMQKFLEYIRGISVTSVNKDSFKEDLTIGTTQYTMATGGLHSKDRPRRLISKIEYINNATEFSWDNISDDSYVFAHFDITSFYPSIMGVYKVAPDHLDKGVFSKLVLYIRDTRIKAKHSEDPYVDGVPKDLLAQALKIVINSIYGKLGDENSDICDRLAVLKVTINGQLFTLMLCEELELNGIKVVSANTDGIVVKIYKTQKEKFDEITSNWLEHTRLGADSELYRSYINRDINNYVALFLDNDELEYKGDYNPTMHEVDLSKGYNQPIVSKAAINYLLYNKPILETLYESTDILDFCKTQNISRKFHNEFYFKNDVQHIQRNIRFYVTKAGGYLYKVDEVGKKNNLCAGYRVSVLNTLDDAPISQRFIDYEYYYRETLKLVDPIMLGISPNDAANPTNKTKSGKSLIHKYSESYNTLFDDIEE